MTRVVLACLTCLVLVEAQAPAGLLFDMPPGWRLRPDAPPGQVTFLAPGVPPGNECAVVILPVQEAAGPAQAVLEQLVRNVSAANRTLAGPDFNDLGPFRVAVLIQQSPSNVTQYLALHVARWHTKSQAVVFIATDPELFRSHTPAVHAMLKSVTMPAAASTAPSRQTAGPQPAATAASSRPRVVEAYRRAAQRAQMSLYGGTSVERVHFERIVLLSNGVADFVRYHAMGLAADPELAAATGETLNGYYGTWRAKGNTVCRATPARAARGSHDARERQPRLWRSGLDTGAACRRPSTVGTLRVPFGTQRTDAIQLLGRLYGGRQVHDRRPAVLLRRLGLAGTAETAHERIRHLRDPRLDDLVPGERRRRLVLGVHADR
jgi:hypothetical protein